MLYDAVVEIGHAVWKNGLSLGTIGTLIYVVLKQRKIKRRLRRFLPFLFEDDSEVRAYVNNQQQIMENQRRIMAAMGVEPTWSPEPSAVISRTSSDSANGRRASSSPSWAALSRVRGAAGRALSYITHSNWRLMNVKKWIRPDALTVIGGVLAAAVTRYFGVEVDPANLLAAAILLLGYFKAHEYVTVVRDANGLPTGFRINSRKFVFTLVAFALIVADVALQLGLGNELIFTVTAAVTGYNYAEGRKDAKQAEAEAEAARQTY